MNRILLKGNVLFPYLFTIYINNLIEKIDKNIFEVISYADDISEISKIIRSNGKFNIKKVIIKRKLIKRVIY